MHRRHLLLALPALATTARGADAPLQVVASFSILADWVREIAGDAAVVSALVGANADAHVYEPTPADVRRVAHADLVVLNGLGFEGWIERLATAAGRARRVVATEGIVPRRVGPAVDPHVWHSLPLAERCIDTLRAALATARPERAADFARRADDYRARLRALEERAQAAMRAIPVDARRVITSHDAFGYLGDAFDIRFVAPRGWNTDAEPSAAQVATLVRQVRALQVRALFVENITDRRLVDRIARDTGAVVGGTLYSDALSPPGTEADTFLRLYEHNVTTLATALRRALAATAR